jgi:hypothetical protein
VRSTTFHVDSRTVEVDSSAFHIDSSTVDFVCATVEVRSTTFETTELYLKSFESPVLDTAVSLL